MSNRKELFEELVSIESNIGDRISRIIFSDCTPDTSEHYYSLLYNLIRENYQVRVKQLHRELGYCEFVYDSYGSYEMAVTSFRNTLINNINDFRTIEF